MKSSRTRAAAVAVLGLRIVYGAGLIAAPGRLGRRWLGPASATAPTQVPMRALGMREIVLHVGALLAALRGAPLRPWLIGSIAGDLSDIAATIAGRGELPDGAARATVAVGGGSALISAGLAFAAERQAGQVGLAYDRTGSGPALVLLHALGADRRVWDPLIGHLRDHREVVTVDLPGFGESPPLDAGEPTPRALATAVAQQLDRLGLDRPHVAGNSLGGWVALELGLQGVARTVTGIAPAGLWPEPLAPKAGIARRLSRALLPLVGPAAATGPGRRLLLSGVMARPARVPGAAAADLVRSYALAPGFDAVNAAMRAGRFEGLERIRCPLTLVWPEDDRLVSRPRWVPDRVRTIELAGAGHIPMWDATERLSEILLEAGAGGSRCGGDAPDAVARAQKIEIARRRHRAGHPGRARRVAAKPEPAGRRRAAPGLRQHAEAIKLREALRAVMLAHNGAPADERSAGVRERVAQRGALSVQFHSDGSVGWRRAATAGVAFQRAGILARAPKQPISMFAAVVILVVVSLVLGVLIPDPPRQRRLIP